MAINNDLLLYIEPKEKPSVAPIIDSLTKKMSAAFNRADQGTYPYEPDHKGTKEFVDGDGYFGKHVCSCGAESYCHDYRLPNGEITNSLCIHYLAFHRNEIPANQLKRVENLKEGEEEPDDEGLKWPLDGVYEIFNGKKQREKYLKEHGQNV